MRLLRVVFLVSCAVVLAGCGTPVTPAKVASVDQKKKGFLLASTDSGVEYYVRSPGDGYAGPSAFHGAQKPVTLLALAPGRYSIGDWYMVAGVQKRASGSEKYEFEIVAGEVTYIGHFEANFSKSKNMMGLSWIPHAAPVVRNRAAADLADFKRVYPALAALKIRNVAVDGFDFGLKAESVVPLPVPLPK